VKKVTITLDEKSIAFFKEQADKLNTSYQRMIRTLLAEYVSREQERDQNLRP
jgi:predicted DNA binding CopG/RHH family protein